MATGGRNLTAYEVIYYSEAEGTGFGRFWGALHPTISSPRGSSRPHSTAAGLFPFFYPHTGIQGPSLWAAGVWECVALATCLALWLQWSATGAGMFVYYRMHPIGLGCRTIALLIYGILGTMSFLLLLGSSALAHLSRPRSGSRYRYSRLRSFREGGAILSRWLGKAVGVTSGIGILVVSLIQPLGIFNNCWCLSMMFDRSGKFVASTTGDYAKEWGAFKGFRYRIFVWAFSVPWQPSRKMNLAL